ncbi:MAG: exodeoxyribonuclease VII large subunit [Ruminococcus sp.]|nr:exodeoxyribonuclease VII large subunit [Ruminococcus sp.]
MNTTPKILKVSQLNFYLKSLIENDNNLRFVFLEGEISNLTDHYSSGHIYFSLKDEKSVIKAVMFSYAAKNLKFRPENGMKVILRGRVSVYEPSGQYQLYVEDMQPDGVGALSLQFEQLKEKLSKEGLFDKSHKKPLPQFPETIGVITSPTGAAVRDIFNVLSRRYKSADIVMCPVLVQGENAAAQLTNAVKRFSENKIADVIIIGRGGGSIEDLWAFNDENLACAIYACDTPVISAVGHETDFTICDFVSDLRAPTPSAAAELAVPDSAELLLDLSSQEQYLRSIMDKKLSDCNNTLMQQTRLLSAFSPLNTIDNGLKALENTKSRILTIGEQFVDSNTKKLSNIASKLSALNPVSVLMRGYSFITNENKKNITSVNDVDSGDFLSIRVFDGTINATVNSKEEL